MNNKDFDETNGAHIAQRLWDATARTNHSEEIDKLLALLKQDDDEAVRAICYMQMTIHEWIKLLERVQDTVYGEQHEFTVHVNKE